MNSESTTNNEHHHKNHHHVNEDEEHHNSSSETSSRHHSPISLHHQSTQQHLTHNSDNNESPSRIKVIGTVSFYLIAALVMVMVNKWVLNSIPAPLFFLFCQLVIAVILLKIFAWFGVFTLPTLHLSICKSLIPLITINVLGLTFNTYCLQYVDASFYQVARGLVLPFTVLASYIFLGTRSSTKIHVSILIVCIGFILGVSSEKFTSVSNLGIALGIFSSMTTSMHAIIMKRALSKVSGTIDLTYYTNLLSALVILPLIIFSGEIGTVLEMIGGNDSDGFSTFLIGTVVTGVFGFLICVAGVLSIKVTSPVTHMISSAVRGVFQTVLSAAVFGDVITSGRLGGITIILVGSIYYTWVKDQELNERDRSSTNNENDHHMTERYPMRDLDRHEIEPLVKDSDQSVVVMDVVNGEELDGLDEDDRELIEAARTLGIDHRGS